MGDKQHTARVAWATIKLTQAGQRPVSLDQLATQVGLPAAETARLPQLTWQQRTVDITPNGVERIDPPTAVVAVVNLEVDLTLEPDHTDAEARRLVDRLAATPPSHAKDVTAPDGDHTMDGWRHPAAVHPRSGR
jgi:hypothetical protein